MTEFPKPRTTEQPKKRDSHRSAETLPGQVIPAQVDNLDNLIQQTKEQGLGEGGSAPTGQTGNTTDDNDSSEINGEISGGPAPGKDPFANLRKKYGSDSNRSQNSEPAEPEEYIDSSRP